MSTRQEALALEVLEAVVQELEVIPQLVQLAQLTQVAQLTMELLEAEHKVDQQHKLVTVLPLEGDLEDLPIQILDKVLIQAA